MNHTYQKLKVSIDLANADLKSEIITKIVSEIRPSWKNVNFHTFSDGITNKMFGLWEDCAKMVDSKDVLVVRINGNGTSSFIDRENELKSWSILEAANAAPKLYCLFENGLCMEYIKGKTLTTDSIKSEIVSSNNTHVIQIIFTNRQEG